MLEQNMEIFGLWAKSEPRQSLLGHMLIVGAVVKELLLRSVFRPVLELLAQLLRVSEEEAAAFAAYIAALHDWGKTHPSFQQRGPLTGSGELFRPYPAEENSPFRHEKYSVEIMKRVGRFSTKTNKLIGQILAQHHQGKSGWGRLNPQWMGAGVWLRAQEEIETIIYRTFAPPALRLEDCHRDAVCTTLLGITILADWIASGPYFSELDISSEEPIDFCRRVEMMAGTFIKDGGLADTGLPKCGSFTETWPQIPSDTMRPLQKTVEEFFADGDKKPLAVIIEAPMGEGKTEAGVYAALKLAKLWGKRGFYIGLPTSATSNQMHSRIDEMMEMHGLPGTRLLHAMAWLLDDAAEEKQIQTEDEETARSWTRSAKRGLLAPYSVGTIDQAMMAALQVKYGVLRLLGLENKVLILDEVHAYDTYMSEIIATLLSWCRALRIPVVMLSATLPSEKKRALMDVYGDYSELTAVYPALTAAYDGAPAEVVAIPATYQKYKVKTSLQGLLGNHGGIADAALERTKDGGCLCVLMNTVADAQAVYQRLKDCIPADCELMLFHARFSAGRRAELESKCVELFGKDKSKRPSRAILVATQTLEQSLDLDFDRLITAIAPIDLLLQRMGRLHRHRDTQRPESMREAVMEILVPAEKTGKHPFGANEKVYPPVLLNRTWELIGETPVIRVPEDISRLVEQVYSHAAASEDELTKWAEYAFETELAKVQASVVELPKPKPRTFSLGEADLIFDDAESSLYLSAKTRLGEASVRLALVPVTVYEQVGAASYIPRELAKAVLSYSTSVPERRLIPFMGCADRAGRPILKGKGLLAGTLVCAAEGGVADFGKAGAMCMDDEIGFFIKKGDSQ